MTIEHYKLSNGATVLIDPNPYAEQVSLSYFYRVGSRHERKHENGAAHFLEHMFFRGTEHRSSTKLKSEIDDLGAQSGGMTGREFSSYSLTGKPDCLLYFNDLLVDMLVFPSISEKDVDIERHAILQEMGERREEYPSLARENVYSVAFPNSSFGTSISGSEANIETFTPDVLIGFKDRYYHAGNLIVCAAGNVDREMVLADLHDVANYFPEGRLRYQRQPEYVGGAIHEVTGSKRLNLTLAFKSVAEKDIHAPALDMLSGVLAADSLMSSRLFREVREKRGLAYGITAFNAGGTDTGLFEISTGTSADKGDELLSVISKEITKLQNDPISKKELARSKERYEAFMATLDPGAAYWFNFFGKPVEVPDLIQAYEDVTVDDVMNAAQLVFSAVPSLSTVGPQGSQPDYGKLVNALEM
jgi:predicted Zn-dependent peptidase